MLHSALLVVIVASAFLAIGAYLSALNWLSRNGATIQPLLIGLFLPKYLNQYKAQTRQKNGRLGPAFPTFLISINLALVTFLLRLFL